MFNSAVAFKRHRLVKVVFSFTFIAVVCVTSSCALRPASDPPQKIQSPPVSASPLLPKPAGLVNDYANVFDQASKKRLESMLQDLKTRSAIEFAVVTVETTGGHPIFDYSLAVSKEWGIGPKDTSQGGGLLLMVATKDRQWRLQVSRSLEKDLPDDVCKDLGEKSREFYRQGRYAEGIENYVDALIERLEKLRGFSVSRPATD